MTRVFFIFVILLLLCAPELAQSMGPAWVSRYDGPANAEDEALAIAVDVSGNVYVTGYSTGDGTSRDYLTIKYLPTGDTAWVRRYDGPANSDDVAQAIAVDPSGNVCVTGWSYGVGTSMDCATIKYDPSGDELWVRRYNGSANAEDLAWAIAVDDSGNVYIAGQGFYEDTERDCVTIKYTPDGDTTWLRRFDGPTSGHDFATALALDDCGYVYVAGQSLDPATMCDYVTIKYFPDGDTAWARRYDSQGLNLDAATAVAVDLRGNVYVTGESYLDGGTDRDYLTIRYYPNGDTTWTRRYNGPADGPDKPYDVGVDAYSRVYVTGTLHLEAG